MSSLFDDVSPQLSLVIEIDVETGVEHGQCAELVDYYKLTS